MPKKPRHYRLKAESGSYSLELRKPRFILESPPEPYNAQAEAERRAAASQARTLWPRFRRGRGTVPVPWRELVRQWHDAGLSFPKIWSRARQHVRQDASIIVAVVDSSADPACQDDGKTHPRGRHWHCRDRRGQVVPVAAQTIKNALTRFRHP